MKSCQTCKHERCSDEVYFNCAAKDYQKWERKEEMSNEMPELKPGMVVSGEFKNDNGGKEKYTGILLECDNSLFVVYATIDGKLKYISDIKNDEIDKISKMKRPSIFTAILSSDNLETIWERKPAVDWSKVAVDTKVIAKIYLRDDESYWKKYHFAGYWNNKAVVFSEGHTSFTAGHCNGDYADFDDGDIVLYEGNEHLVGDKHE